MFLYACDGIQWTTDDHSGGVNGLGGNEALAGINAGDGINSITINGSLTPEIINIDKTSNVGSPGIWMFQIGKCMLIFHSLYCIYVRTYRVNHCEYASKSAC